uniref:replication restart helicase PriA n=2 Tax=Alistipes TaxID=239759 RepID=UPI0023EF6884
MFKTYMRLLGFVSPISKYAVPYFFYALLYALFNTLTYAMILPIMNTLFDDKNSYVFQPVYDFPMHGLSFSDIDASQMLSYVYTQLFGTNFTMSKMLLLLACGTIVMNLLSNFFRYMSAWTVENMRVRSLQRMRNDLFNKIMGMNAGYFSDQRKGDLMSRITQDVMVVQFCITNTLQVAFREPFLIIGYMIALVKISWELTIFSAIFLPLRRLELVVVDEEHDPSYKQTDPAPRYQARDCAVLMTRLLGCRTLLGSATPSLESYLNAATGKYGSVVLAERYGPSRMPQILVSDTIRAVKRGERHAHFNKLLLDRMEETLGGGGQAMLFQNRRGFAPYVECRECGWTARCPDCNVTLTLHKGSGRMVCHYCGHTEPVPAKCPHCRVTEPVPMGFGTEKVEEEIARVFPEARVARLDRDSVTSERAFRQIVEAFARGDDDILVGTQMITKGFDFGGVELVGVLNADNLLNNPDFRSAERAFQLLMQVAGRAGRRENPGTVVIQTAEPGHPVLQQVIAGDYEAMARQQLAERKAFFYPPYARLLNLLLRHRDPVTLRRAANALAAALRPELTIVDSLCGDLDFEEGGNPV